MWSLGHDCIFQKLRALGQAGIAERSGCPGERMRKRFEFDNRRLPIGGLLGLDHRRQARRAVDLLAGAVEERGTRRLDPVAQLRPAIQGGRTAQTVHMHIHGSHLPLTLRTRNRSLEIF